MTRQERISLHKKQERTHVSDGQPVLGEMKEGVPVLRNTGDGLVEFVKVKDKVRKKVLTPSASISDAEVEHSITDDDSDLSAANETELEKFYNALGGKINLILVALKKQNIIR